MVCSLYQTSDTAALIYNGKPIPFRRQKEILSRILGMTYVPVLEIFHFPVIWQINQVGSSYEKFKHERLKSILAIEHRLHQFNNNKEEAEFSIIHHIKRELT